MLNATATATCTRCGRTLRATSSVARGYGRTCAKRIATKAAALAATIKPLQLTKAVELVEMNGVIPSRKAHVFYAVGSTGNLYRSTANGCTCPAGLRGVPCYHRAAVALLGR